jgi:hypothetical protein
LNRQLLAIILTILCIVIAASLLLVYFWPFNKTDSSPNSDYLLYRGRESKIYLLGEKASFGNSNESYTTLEGTVIEQETPLYIISLALRNDYTSDSPPPPQPDQIPISPSDGTAYLYISTQIYKGKTQLNAKDVSISDFTLPTLTGSGFILSSGETVAVNIYLTTSQTSIDTYQVNLSYLGDSIPLNNK